MIFCCIEICFNGTTLKVTQLCPTLCDPMNYTVHGILQARILEWIPFPSPGDLPNPGIEPRSSALQADSLTAEPLGKPKNTGVGSLSLLQQTFPIQESNRSLLYWRRILYQQHFRFSSCLFIYVPYKTICSMWIKILTLLSTIQSRRVPFIFSRQCSIWGSTYLIKDRTCTSCSESTES